MQNRTVVTVAPDASFSGVGVPILTQTERRILARTDTSLFFAPWLNFHEPTGFPDAHRAVIAAPVEADEFPTHAQAGPDEHPELRADTEFPVGVLWTPTNAVMPSWTIAQVSRASSQVFGTPIVGIAGNGGDGIGMGPRSGDLFRVIRYNETNASSSNSDVLASIGDVLTGEWHHSVVSYDAQSETLRVWINGELEETVTSLSLSAGTSRITLMGAHDAQGFTDGGSRGARLALAMVCNSADPAVAADMIAAGRERFPSVIS